MNTIKACEEVVDFIAAGTTPQNVIAFRPSEAAQERVEDLLAREKEGELSPAEKSELDHYLQLEHLVRMAKARARDFLWTWGRGQLLSYQHAFWTQSNTVAISPPSTIRL